MQMLLTCQVCRDKEAEKRAKRRKRQGMGAAAMATAFTTTIEDMEDENVDSKPSLLPTQRGKSQWDNNMAACYMALIMAQDIEELEVELPPRNLFNRFQGPGRKRPAEDLEDDKDRLRKRPRVGMAMCTESSDSEPRTPTSRTRAKDGKMSARPTVTQPFPSFETPTRKSDGAKQTAMIQKPRVKTPPQQSSLASWLGHLESDASSSKPKLY
jgi:hypothetical protein